ncbi:MAG: hypothetical protein GC201_11220 [Alphaproteobacteria bacterium]|nr:hypothetical protein [Alphaproteobacteria bacterium]
MRWSAGLRTIVLAVGLLAAAPGRAEPVAGVPPSGAMDFTVSRKGDQMGTASLTFTRRDGLLEVRAAVDLTVRLLFVTVYRYHHESTEVWSGDHLVSLDSRTRENGRRWQVTARAGKDGQLRVDAGGTTRILPDTLPPTSYWRPSTVQHARWLNSQFGSPSDVTVTPLGQDSVDVAGGMVDAAHYKVRGRVAETGKPIDLDLWYAGNGELVRIRSVADSDGSLLEFHRIR